ncbi:hypothetical protein [Streptomyces sp. SAI-129]
MNTAETDGTVLVTEPDTTAGQAAVRAYDPQGFLRFAQGIV